MMFVKQETLEESKPLVERVSDAARDGDQAGLAASIAVAQGDELNEEVLKRFVHLSRESTMASSDSDAGIRGALGLFLFCHFAERWHTDEEDDPVQADDSRTMSYLELANGILLDHEVVQQLYRLYDIPREHQSPKIRLRAVGTTSFIFHLEQRDLALKTVKPWYFSEREIKTQTRTYKENYGHLIQYIPQHTPEIFMSTDRIVLMTFVHAKPLRHFFRHELWSPAHQGAPADDPLFRLEQILTNICSVLKCCADGDPSLSHGDISTENILYDPISDKVWLLDFGINYLLHHRVGGSQELTNLTDHIPPEMRQRDSNSKPTIAGDVYALAEVVIEGLLGPRFERGDVQHMMDRVYEQQLEVGPLLDDMLDPRQACRLSGVDRSPELYVELADRIRRVLRQERDSYRNSPNRHIRALDSALKLVLPLGSYDLWRIIVRREIAFMVSPPTMNGFGQLRGDGKRLLVVLVPTLMNLLAIVLFLYRIWSADGLNVRSSEGLEILVGWTVALVYAISAARYFVFVFADIETEETPGRTWLTTPFTAVVAWFAILWPLIVNPDHWPLCVAFGVLLIFINNRTWHSACVNMQGSIRLKKLPVSSLMETAVRYLNEWQVLMLMFFGCLVALSVLIFTDVLQDIAFYGLLVGPAANVRMYFFQTKTESPQVHGGIHRTVAQYHRSQLNCPNQAD